MLSYVCSSVFPPRPPPQLLCSCCSWRLLSCFLCSLSMSSSVMSSLRTSGIKNSSLTMFCGKCFSLSRVSYMPSYVYHKYEGEEILQVLATYWDTFFWLYEVARIWWGPVQHGTRPSLLHRETCPRSSVLTTMAGFCNIKISISIHKYIHTYINILTK